MRIAVIAPAWNLPVSGGRWGLHLIAKELAELGHDAFLVGIAYEYEEVPCKVVEPDQYEVSPEDFLLVPEGYFDTETDYYRMFLSKEHAGCIVYCQNHAMVGAARPWETHYWALGPAQRELVRKAMKIPEELPIEELLLPVDSEKFRAGRKEEGSIAFSPRVERNGPVLEFVVRKALDCRIYRVLGLTRHEVAERLGKADIVPLASYAEGQSCFSNEAMAAECAVVTWPSGGMVDHCIHEETALVVPQNEVFGLIDSVRRLQREPELARELGRNARQLMKERYSFEAFRKSLQAAAEKLQ